MIAKPGLSLAAGADAPVDWATHYRALFEEPVDVLLLLRGTRIMDCNDDAARCFALPKSTLVGSDFAEYAPKLQPDGSDSFEKLRRLVQRCLDGERHTSEWLIRCADGRESLSYICLSSKGLADRMDVLVLLRNVENGNGNFRQMLESEYLYRMLITKSPIAITLHRAGTVLYHNPSYATLLGYTPDRDLTGTDIVQTLSGDDSAEIREVIAKRERGEIEESTIKVYGLDSKGERFPAQIYGVRVQLSDGPASIAFIHDLRESEQAAEALRQSKADLEAIIESTDDMIWSVEGESLKLISYNRAFSDYMYEAYRVRVEPGVDVLQALPVERRPFWQDLYRRSHHESSIRSEFLSLATDRIFELTFRPVSEQGRPRSIIIFAKDLTATRKAEDNERLIRERMFQAEKLTSLGLLVAGIAHEINNPNQYISANLGMLADAWKSAIPVLDEYRDSNGDFLLAGLSYEHLREEIPQLFASVQNGARRIDSIISELKSFAGSDNVGELVFVDINKAASGAIELSRGMIKRKTSRFELRLSPKPLMIRAIAQRIEQVVINLVQNACEALPDSNKLVELATGTTDAGYPFFSVRDEGRGMSGEELSKILTPFYTTRRDSGGTGLGLFVSTNIVRSYGGELTFSSEPGVGTTATVVFRQEQIV